jgi:hypothetical protein
MTTFLSANVQLLQKKVNATWLTDASAWLY